MTTDEQRAKHAEKMRRYRAAHPEYVAKGREAIRQKREADPTYARVPNDERQRQRAEYMRAYRAKHAIDPSLSPLDGERRPRSEYMKEWRAKNPGRQSEIDKAFLERWRQEHPEVKVGYHAWWRKVKNPESVKRSQRKRIDQLKEARAADPEPFRVKDRARRKKYDGLPETHFHNLFGASFPAAFALDRIRPDFYVPGEGFVEIKCALPYQAYNWRHRSTYFPDLFFRFVSASNKRWNGDRRTVDAQIDLCPRPLLVIVYNPLTQEELARRLFQ